MNVQMFSFKIFFSIPDRPEAPPHPDGAVGEAVDGSRVPRWPSHSRISRRSQVGVVGRTDCTNSSPHSHETGESSTGWLYGG